MTEPRYTTAELLARMREVYAEHPDIPERIVIVVTPEPPSCAAELASSGDDGA